MYRSQTQHRSTATDATTARATGHRATTRAAAVTLVGFLVATGAACAAPTTHSGSSGTPTQHRQATGSTNDHGRDDAADGAPAAAPDSGSDIQGMAGDYGPDTCRQGYVWREARPTDHVCVDPQVRDQARTDNAQADNRRSPNTNGNGPNACATGYVWREAYAGDLVCVDPRVRDQARTDNAQADDRRVTTRLWKTRWTPSGNAGTGRSDQDVPRIQLNGDHYNFGQVRLYIRRTSDNRILWSGTVTATRHTSFAGASFGKRTNLTDCSAYNTPINGYAQAYDVISHRWSARLPVSIGCATL